MLDANIASVLLIDDEEHIRVATTQALDLAGYRVQSTETAEKGLALIDRDWPGIVISDIRLPGMSGVALLHKLVELDADLPVILITGHGDVGMAVDAMRGGAYDFIEKPFPSERLVDAVGRAMDKRTLTLENRALRNALAASQGPASRITGDTPAIQQLRETIAQVASTDADVLVCGETGSGKELVARSLHEHSRRRGGNFVAVNCGAVPDNLIESELFGHEAGAFTGAKSRRVGKFEHANGGTLFLDEIESMPLNIQVHLLRVLQERTLERLGSNELIPLDIRVVAASKADLVAASAQGEFRLDLYYRLNVVSIDIPPLRQRMEDIPQLFQQFVLQAAVRHDREVPTPRPDQLNALLAHDWPGNVRELRNIAERYVLLGEGCNFQLERLFGGATETPAMTLPEQLECFERSMIQQQLKAQQGSIKRTMEVLGLPRKTLYDKMKKLGIERDDYTA